ncbi:TonB-dependent receptor [Porphyromonas pogonae]|uniref:TonB-dependent receptor plug domain-containing protein n=1 Tax=Porphyromonas pogonae TaxID=867595 RepID=UPI002E76FDAB|nr:TonB-dependent receptor [Porphyromonas pogonae]
MVQKLLCTLCVSASLASAVFAQNAEVKHHAKKGDTDEVINLNTVVVTGTGTKHFLKNTPSPVKVLGALDIKRAGITSFQEALTMLDPSLSFSNNSMGSYLTLNGLSNKYVLILIDGKKLTGDTAGNIDLSRINVSNIRKIEILKGAGSALYGSDAIGGVINIITNEPSNLISVTSNSKIETHKQFTQQLNADITTEKIGSYTSFTHEQSEGWQLSDVDIDGKPTPFMASGGSRNNIFNQKFTFTPIKPLSFYLSGGLFDRTDVHEGYPYSMDYAGHNIDFGSKYYWGHEQYISLDIHSDNYKSEKTYREENKKAKINPGDVSLTKKQRYFSGNLKGTFKTWDWGQAILGAEYIRENLERPDANLDKGVYTIALYGQEEVSFADKFKAVLGARAVKHETAGSSFTPKALLMYSPGKFNFRAQYSIGFRAPGLEELNYFLIKGSTLVIGNENLKPEKSNYGSLNAEYAGNSFNFSVTGYINHVKDMIAGTTQMLKNMTADEQKAIKERVAKEFGDAALKAVKNVKQYGNLDQALIKGFETNASYFFNFGLTLSANYSYVSAKGKSYDTKAKEYLWTPLERSIRHTGTFNANYTHSWDHYKLNVNLLGRVQSKRYYVLRDEDRSAPGFGLWNFVTRHTFSGFKGFILEPSVGVNNILNYKDDRPYGTNYATINPGRTYFASLLVKFRY